jgi:hypothetical protein
MKVVRFLLISHRKQKKNLKGCGNEEILLLETQLLACPVVVVGIENLHGRRFAVKILTFLAIKI